MNGAVLAQIGLRTLLQSPITWGLVVLALGLWVTLNSRDSRMNRLGQVITAFGLLVLAIALPPISQLSNVNAWTSQVTFWLMAGSAIGCSIAAITARNPVYTAIWFAGSLLGVSGLFLFQNAQFLGFATIVVYAGAIVVTFLFVLMLANPEGHANYDRISWAKFPATLMVFASTAIVVIIAMSWLSHPPASRGTADSVLSQEHVAHLGGVLFARHLVSVEVAGTILLVALVGAIAIVLQSKEESQESHPSVELSSRRDVS